MKLEFHRKLQAGFFAALGFLTFIGIIAWWNARENAEAFRAVAHTYQVIDGIQDTLTALLDLETGSRGYVISGDPKFLVPYQHGREAAEKNFALLTALTADNPTQQQRLASLAPLINKKFTSTQEIIRRRQRGDTTGAWQLVTSGDGRETMDLIRSLFNAMQKEEGFLLQQRTEISGHQSQQTMLVVGLGSLAAIVFVGLAGFQVRRDYLMRQQAEAENERIFNLSQDLLCIASADGYFKRVSPSVTTLLGWSPEEFLARPFIERVHPDDRAATLQEVEQQVIQGQNVLHFENRYQHKDGSWRILAWKSTPQPGGLMYANARDVTDLRRAEAFQRRLAAIVESSDDAILSKTLDGLITSWNPGAERLLGYTADEIVGQPVTKLFPADRLEEESYILDRLKNGAALVNFETVRLAKNGRQIQVAVTISPIRNGTGQIIGVANTVRDITQRKQMEEALRRSEENLAVTLHSIGDAVLATDTQGNVTRMNPVAEKLTGWPQAEAIGRPINEVFNIINEETRQPAEVPVAKVLATGQVQGLANHTVIITRDGTEYPIADSAAPIRGTDGQILGVVLVFRDVTEEKKAERAIAESERQLRQLNEELAKLVAERSIELQATGRLAHAALDALTAHVAVLDEQGVIIATNKSWQDFAAQNELCLVQAGHGVNYLEICDQATGPGVETARRMAQGIRDIITGQRPYFSLEYDCHSPKQKRWFLARVTGFASPGPARVVVAHEDITQMKLMERQQIRNQRMESLGTLAGGVAHDLNNALAPVIMASELLREQYPADTSIVDIITSSAKRGADMVRQLLTFARGAEGERNPIQLKHLVKELQNIIQGTFPKNIQVEVEYGKDLPLVTGDATQLHQVLLNLCVNARDAMPHGGKLKINALVREIDSIYASSVHDARPGRYIALSVRDTGTGIPPEIIDRIFDPFFTTKSPDKGTGLGLSTVLGIVKSHGGFMQVYSHPGEGSTFTAFLPTEKPAGGTEHIVRPTTSFRGQGEIILFVDDEPTLRGLARTVLQRLNFKPVIATDGLDALVKLAEHRAALRVIITDLHMPQMDGLTYVRSLRQILPHIAVVVSSGRLEEKEREEFKKLGVAAYLDKPFTETQLAETLKKILAPD